RIRDTFRLRVTGSASLGMARHFIGKVSLASAGLPWSEQVTASSEVGSCRCHRMASGRGCRSLGTGLIREPCTLLRVIDPFLDEAGGGTVVVFLADAMGFA